MKLHIFGILEAILKKRLQTKGNYLTVSQKKEIFTLNLHLYN